MVKFARYSIGVRLGFNLEKPEVPERLRDVKLGVWASLEKIKSVGGVKYRELRGDVGSPYPRSNVVDDVAFITVNAAFNSPKYSPLSPSEFKRVVIELTFNSVPRRIDIDSLPSVMIPGYHGILVTRPNGSTEAYLPQKTVDIALKFIDEKGRLPGIHELISVICGAGCVDVKIFETQIFYELEPGGDVVEREPYLNMALRNINRKIIEAGQGSKPHSV